MAAQIEPGVWYVIQEAVPAEVVEEVIRGVDSAGSSDSAASFLHEKSTAIWEVVEPAVLIFFDLLRQYHVQPAGLACRICGCALEGHLLSADHFARLSCKCQAHAPEAALRDAFWQEIRAPGSYVVRFNHVDFEVQLCFGEPPPPHIPPKPGGELPSMLFCKADEATDAAEEKDLEIPEAVISPYVMAAVDELINSGHCEREQLCKEAKPSAVEVRPVPTALQEPKPSPREASSSAVGQSPTKLLASSSTDSKGSLKGSPDDLVATEACMPQLPMMPAFEPLSPSDNTFPEFDLRMLTPLPSVRPPKRDKAPKASPLIKKEPKELSTPPSTPFFPFTPPPPSLRPGYPAPPPSVKMAAPAAPLAPAAPEPDPVGLGSAVGAKRPVLRPPVGEDHLHLQPGRAVVSLLDGAWWPATVQSFCPKTGMAKVFWERQDRNAYPTVVDARRLRPRAAATGPTEPLQPRITGSSRSFSRTMNLYPQRVQPVQRHEPEISNTNVFVAQELQQLDATLNSVRDAAKRAFESGAYGVTVRLQAACDNDVASNPVRMPKVRVPHGTAQSPIVSRPLQERVAPSPLFPASHPPDPVI